MLNIGSNAIKFTNQGSVTFAVSFDETQDHLVFIMKDTGVGIEQKQQQRLFQRFEQADNTTTRKLGGIGLGLSITHSLVTLMSGEIKVDSEVAVGTTITVNLPLDKAVAPVVERKSFDGHLAKPLELSMLLEELQQILLTQNPLP